jgi:hypothetical protein
MFGAVGLDSGDDRYSLAFHRGEVILAIVDTDVPSLPWFVEGGMYAAEDWPLVQWLPEWHLSIDKRDFMLPLWMLWLPLAGFTAWRWRADRLPSPHACTKCGYDRSGIAADAKCPECGAGPTT